MKSAISHEYSTKLETHKSQLAAQQQIALEGVRFESSRQIERVKHEYQLEAERTKAALQAEVASDERIRSEILRWANPILGAVQTLHARLTNIVEHDGYLALHRSFQHSQWSMTYEYFMSSSLYAFASYFCWVRMLEERMSFEMFRGDDQKSQFFGALEKVSHALRMFPPSFSCTGQDAQVFILQQRAVGEMVARDLNGRPACMSYDEFEASLDAERFAKRLAPFRALLQDLNVEEGCRWTRLVVTLEALGELRTVCRRILNVS